jgi:GT2 family glycosyltransferase
VLSIGVLENKSMAAVIPALSVIIACRNGATTLRETLDGLAAQRWDKVWEVVLADNGSTDGTIALFETFARAHPELAMRAVEASARPGQQHAMNAGIAAALAPAVAFCDADDVPGKGWLAAMGDALAVHPIAAARMDFARLNVDWVARSRDGFQRDGLERLAFLPSLVHSGGGGLGLRKAVVESIGGFDPEYRYLMDTEFCIRAQLAGFPIVFVPEAVMHIRGRAELGPMFRQSYNWGKYEMKLVARYRDRVDFAGGWWPHLRAWRRLLRHHLRKGLRPRPETMLNAAWLRAGAGRLSGQLTGMLRYRVPPYRPPISGRASDVSNGQPDFDMAGTAGLQH